MFPRCFFALCALVLFAVVCGTQAEVNDEDVEISNADLELLNSFIAENVDDDVEGRNPLLAVAIRVLGQAVKWAAKHCLKDAAMHCKGHWKNPKNLVNCGKKYLQANKGRCVVG